MHLHDSGLKLKQSKTTEINDRISLFFKNFRCLLDDDKLFKELLGIKPKVNHDPNSFILGTLSTRQLFVFTKNAGISFERMIEGKVDVLALVKRMKGDRQALPERYLEKRHQLARMRAIQSILCFVEMYSGQTKSERLLKNLQVHKTFLSHPDQFVSPLLTKDLLYEVKREGFDEKSLKKMGSMTYAIVKNTEVGRILAQQRNGKELYRALHEELSEYFDRIWNYRVLKLSDAKCSVEITPKEQTLDVFNGNTLGSRELCLFLQGVYVSFLANVYPDQFAAITEGECMYQGGHRCVYHLTWRPLSDK